MTQAWPKIVWTEAGQVFECIGGAIEPDGDPDELDLAPSVYFKNMFAAGKHRDAVFFVSHALPRYECVVWAAQTLLAADAVDRTSPLVVSVLRWIDDPCEDLRRTVEELVNQETVTSPEYMLAKAAFTSGGSISLPDGAPVLAPPDACAKYAAAAVLDAASFSGDPAQFLRQAAETGDALASQAVQH